MLHAGENSTFDDETYTNFEGTHRPSSLRLARGARLLLSSPARERDEEGGGRG